MSAMGLTILLLIAVPFSCGAAEPISLFCTGNSPSIPYVAAIFKREPMTNAVVFPTRVSTLDVTTEIVKKYVRLYFPRTYEEMLEKYDFILLRGIDPMFFDPTQFEWMRRAIEDGLGGLQDRSVQSMHTAYSLPWAQSPASQAFPNDAEKVVVLDYHRNGPLEVVLNEDPLLPPVFTSYREVLKFDVGWWGSNLMIPKPGSQIYTWAKTGIFPEVAYPEPGLFPHVLGWRYGKGYTWTLEDTTGRSFWDEGANPYGLDVYLAMIMYSDGRKLPEDVVMVHELRGRFHAYSELKVFIYSIMDFVDRFGANTDSLSLQMAEMDGLWVGARDSYIDQEYQQSWSVLEDLLEDLSTLRSHALTFKDRALFWVYVVEWLAVSSTFLMTGFVLWTLMVRRRLYRGVESTRFT